MIAKTPQEKRALAQSLEKDDPEMLDFIKTFTGTFGKTKAVYYNEEIPGIHCKPGLQGEKRGKKS